MTAPLSDHLAQVLLRDPELEHMGVIPNDFLDLDFLRTINQRLNDRHYERLHLVPPHPLPRSRRRAAHRHLPVYAACPTLLEDRRTRCSISTSPA